MRGNRVADFPLERLTDRVIGAAIEVHRTLGPGLLESAYEAALHFELGQAGIVAQRQVDLPVTYKEITLDCGYRVDLLVEQSLVVELKCVEAVHPVHEAQLLTYLKLLNAPVGLLLNFNVRLMKDGIYRRALTRNPSPPTHLS
jgi:GxxExxY protein